VLLTRAPLYRGLLPFSLDLHVLGAPLTFVLSQDQTLQLNLFPDCSSLLKRLESPTDCAVDEARSTTCLLREEQSWSRAVTTRLPEGCAAVFALSSA
jgi:ubiquinone biosynthesis protein UbiJ